MRTDWPIVNEEDSIEPPCEIFLQLFIQNVEMAVDDNSDNEDYDFLFGNGGEMNEQDADELIQNFGPILIEDDSFTDDSDDSILFSMPSPCPVTDAELTPSSSDEAESETESYCEESNNDTHGSQNSFSGISEHSEMSFIQNISSNESQEDVSNCASEEISAVTNTHLKRGSRLCNVYDGSEEVSVIDVQPKKESECSDLIDESKDVSSVTDICEGGESECSDLIDENDMPLVIEMESKCSNAIDGSEELPVVTDAHLRKGSKCSEIELNTDVWLKSENSEASGYSNIVSHEFENYFDVISSKDVPSKMPCVKESPVEFESSASHRGLKRSTHVSLYVVVPPATFLNERSSNLLSGVSTSLPGFIPVNPNYYHYPSLPTSNSENFQLANTSKQINTRSSSDKLASSCTSSMSGGIMEDNQKSNVSDVDFILGNVNSDTKLEHTCYKNEYSELSACCTNQTEESNIVEKNASSDLSDKCISGIKRKVSSVDDNVFNKVPKYSSQTSNDSINQKSLEYCKVLTNNSESILQTSHENEKIDIVSPTVSDNVILTLGKSVEQASVVNEKPKSR